MFFVTVQNIPLATAVTTAYLAPIFTTLIGVFVLGERVHAMQWLFYGMSFAGVFVIKGFDAFSARAVSSLPASHRRSVPRWLTTSCVG